MPLFRRLPKRGFSNVQFRTELHIVNVDDLDERFEDGARVTGQALVEAGLIRDAKLGVKVLGNGEIKVALTVHAHKFSRQAVAKIEAAGGKIELLAK